MKEVAFVTRLLTHYRLPFHEAVRTKLSNAGFRYRLLYSKPTAQEAEKEDLAAPEWAEETPVRYLGAAALCWQDLTCTWRSDLVIISQESKLLSNYLLQVARPFGGPRLAFFGHGKNFQAPNSNGLAERLKRFWIDKVDWWFAYTERSAAIVAQSGFPRERITVFNNSIDTSSISDELLTIAAEEREALRQERFGGSLNVGVYIGGLYDRKRIPFLIETAQAIRARVPDFQLMVIGGGVDAPLVRAAATKHPWIHAVGPKFGREKTLLASLGKVLLMPGLVGLGVLDSFAYGIPMVTTAIPYHSPEIDYLKDGENGVVVKEVDSVEAYAAAVARILHDDAWRRQLQTSGTRALKTYTIEGMAGRFVDGVISALHS